MAAAFEEALVIVLIGGLALFALGYLFGRHRDGRDLSGPPPAGAIHARRSARRQQTRSAVQLDPQIRQKIEQALAAGQKIEAIKLLREASGMGLREAKDAVEDRSF